MAATLKPYPFPPGMAIPRLMPFQEYPWNGDHFLADEVLRLKGAFRIGCAIETGTCLGSTALWLCDHFQFAHTIEVEHKYRDIFIARAGRREGCTTYLGDSVKLLPEAIERATTFSARGLLIWLDAHWSDHCPLLDELDAIAKAGVKPCILIHDFQVPGTDFGFDSMPDGRPFNLELIAGHLDRIYGEGKWKHNYPTQVAGAMRGWISIEPC